MKVGCLGGRPLGGGYYEHKNSACPEYGKKRKAGDPSTRALRELLP